MGDVSVPTVDDVTIPPISPIASAICEVKQATVLTATNVETIKNQMVEDERNTSSVTELVHLKMTLKLRTPVKIKSYITAHSYLDIGDQARLRIYIDGSLKHEWLIYNDGTVGGIVREATDDIGVGTHTHEIRSLLYASDGVVIEKGSYQEKA